MPKPTPIHNDNAACVAWSRNMTSKGLRHIQICKNVVHKNVQNGFVDIQHIAGNMNLADLHFLKIRDTMMTARRAILGTHVFSNPRGVSGWENYHPHPSPESPYM